jgi:hypothetical protein
MGKIQIQVADDSTLRFAQYLTPLKKEFMNCAGLFMIRMSMEILPTGHPLTLKAFTTA